MSLPQLPPGHRYTETRGPFLRAEDEHGYVYVVGCHSEAIPGGERIVTETRYSRDGTPDRKQWRVDLQGRHTPVLDGDEAASKIVPPSHLCVEWSGVSRNFRGQDAEDRCRRWSTNLGQIGTRQWLWLWGPGGVGKSCIATLVARDCAKEGTQVQSLEWPAFLRSVKESWKDDGAGDLIEQMIEAELLILDDVGKDQPTEWAAQVLFEIVNGRERNGKPTMLTSNYTIKECMERYKSDHGAYIRDRIGDASEVELAGASNRG